MKRLQSLSLPFSTTSLQHKTTCQHILLLPFPKQFNNTKTKKKKRIGEWFVGNAPAGRHRHHPRGCHYAMPRCRFSLPCFQSEAFFCYLRKQPRPLPFREEVFVARSIRTDPGFTGSGRPEPQCNQHPRSPASRRRDYRNRISGRFLDDFTRFL